MKIISKEIPNNWKPNDFFAFYNWYKLHIKSHYQISDNYYLLNKKES